MLRQTLYHGNTPWITDHSSIQRAQGGRIAWNNVPTLYTVAESVVNVTTIASANATALVVTALPADMPAGTLLDFGGLKYARVNTKALAGATALAVDAIPTALAVNDKAYYAGANSSAALMPRKHLYSSTVMCRVSGGNGDLIPRYAAKNSETACGVLLTDANELDASAAASGYALVVGGVLYETQMRDYLLPDGSGGANTSAWGTYKTELAAAGCMFKWELYSDNRQAY